MYFDLPKVPKDSKLRKELDSIPGDQIIKINKGVCQGLKWIRGSSNRAECIGTHEWDKQFVMAKFIKKGMTFFDVGANVGFYSLFASKLVGPNGKIFAFEPFPRNAMFLLKHIRLNNFLNAQVFLSAVSDKRRTITFSGHGYVGGISSEAGDLIVNTNSLDLLLKEKAISTPNIIKVDVGGTEDLVLKGAKEILKKKKAIWFIAFHGERQKKVCLRILKKLEYYVYSIENKPISQSGEIIATPRPLNNQI